MENCSLLISLGQEGIGEAFHELMVLSIILSKDLEQVLKENQLLDNIDKISHLPCVIVHGRYDVLCSVSGAFELHRHWSGSELVIVSNAGHASLEPGVALALKEVHD